MSTFQQARHFVLIECAYLFYTKFCSLLNFYVSLISRANTETADILGELDDLRRQLAEKEGELVEAKRAVDALHDQVKYLKQQLNPDSGNEDLLGGSGTNMSLNGTVENWTTNYEDLKMKLKALKKHFQHMASVCIVEFA